MKRLKQLAVIVVFALVFSLCACASGGSGGEGGTSNNVTGGSHATMPTSAQIVQAIKTGDEDTKQNYDFSVTLELTGAVGPFNKGVKAQYDCKYRYDKGTGNLQFMRTTSGALLMDSVKYIYGTDSARVTVKMNDDGSVKKQSVEQTDETLDLLNLPFVSFMNALQAANVKQIESSGTGYSARIGLASGDAKMNAILNIVGLLDTEVSLKGVTIPNPADGIGMDFDLTSDGTRLDEYTITAALAFEVKAAQIGLNLTYTQKRSDTPIVIPEVKGITIDKSEIASKMTELNSALTSVKSTAAYSLDLEAVNEMDPGWNVLATKDTFKSRLYKNTNGTRVDFNNSYEYHSHHETDGSETYKYTLGNIQDGTVHLVSRKGSNAVTPSTGSADARFDYMTRLMLPDSDSVDCIRESAKNGKTTYTVYLKDSVIVNTSKEIVKILNSNPADGVLTVENNFNDTTYTVKDAELIVVMSGGKVEQITLETKIRYNPVSGDYVENNVTLDNSLTLLVNKELDKAQEYEAPDKTEGTLGLSGLIAAKYYIL